MLRVGLADQMFRTSLTLKESLTDCRVFGLDLIFIHVWK